MIYKSLNKKKQKLIKKWLILYIFVIIRGFNNTNGLFENDKPE